jgi:hypothetical protein
MCNYLALMFLQKLTKNKKQKNNICKNELPVQVPCPLQLFDNEQSNDEQDGSV